MNKDGLIRVKNKISFVYIDKSTIMVKDFSVVIQRQDSVTVLPIATINVIMLGIGTSITYDAVVDISRYGCTIIWSGMNLNYFYTYGNASTNSSRNILHQCKCHESKCLHVNVVRNMYHLRYPDEHLKSKSEKELLGLEGIKMQNYYKELSKKYDVDWQGRTYHVNDFNSQDDINKCITTANQLLYSVICAIIVSLGYSAAIGFIHTGNMLSFVYDIADLYKEHIVLPHVFKYCGEGNDDLKQLRDELFILFCDLKFTKMVVDDLNYIFTNGICNDIIDYDAEFKKI